MPHCGPRANTKDPELCKVQGMSSAQQTHPVDSTNPKRLGLQVAAGTPNHPCYEIVRLHYATPLLHLILYIDGLGCLENAHEPTASQMPMIFSDLARAAWSPHHRAVLVPRTMPLQCRFQPISRSWIFISWRRRRTTQS